jgi:alkylation response protein AidB-like acyl-CoA dehydrogenase
MTSQDLRSVSAPVRPTGVALARLFGPLWDDSNPTGARALLAADEAATMSAEGERLLDSFGLNAEFVPPALGGRLTSVPRLTRVLRVVYGRDASLGLGYGASALMASVNVWAAGDERQRQSLARLLLDNGKVATGYHELAHGNDFARASFSAAPGPGGGLRLTGRKEVIANASRADAYVLFARTRSAAGSRSHSQLLVHRADLEPGRASRLPRFRSTGLRGVDLGGLEFDDCPVPGGSVLGEPGRGIETAMRSFQVSRTALPGMWAGSVEAGLVSVLRFVSGRRLYGRAAVDLPLVRRQLAECFADLLVCEALVTVAGRALHLRPAQAPVLAPLSKQFVAGRLLDAMNRLSRVLGAHFYVREGEYALFQKHLRDLAPVGFGHTARAACLAAALPQLPLLARSSRDAGDAAELFDLDAPLPPLDFGRLVLRTDGTDCLGAALRAGPGPVGGAPGSDRPYRAALALLDQVHDGIARLSPRELGPGGGAGPASLAERYGAGLAAGACVGVARWAARGAADPFLADPAWLTGVLTRALAGAGTGTEPPPLTAPVAERFFAELVARHEAGLSLELRPRPLGM